MLTETDSLELLERFPSVEFAFAYGSGVVEQEGYDYGKKDNFPMLDLVLVVENSEQWHTDNMILNPTHYSSLIPLNAKYTALMKYGVINRENLLKDLTTWNHLYAAGRLHKPVHIIKRNPEIEMAVNKNFEHALRTSLLLLPKQFTEYDLFISVASLSYIGDPRMLIGENPKKVVNLVTPIVHHYRHLYQPTLERLSPEAELQKVSTLPHETKKDVFSHVYSQNVSPTTRWKLSLELPQTLKNLLIMENRHKYMKSRPAKPAAIRSALSTIVARSASMQTLKGLFTVGLLKSSSYVLAKMKKRFIPG